MTFIKLGSPMRKTEIMTAGKIGFVRNTSEDSLARWRKIMMNWILDTMNRTSIDTLPSSSPREANVSIGKV